MPTSPNLPEKPISIGTEVALRSHIQGNANTDRTKLARHSHDKKNVGAKGLLRTEVAGFSTRILG